jgi:hypothetical protein
MSFLDQLRKRQIDETLNYDKLMNQKAFRIEKMNGQKEQNEELTPYTQLNSEDIGATNELVNNLIILLEKKFNELDKFIRNNSVDVSKEISNVEDVLNSYNKIVSIYLNPANTQQTKSTILTSIMKIEQYIRALEQSCRHVLNRIYANVTNKLTDGQAAALVFKPCFKAYVAYNLINMQLSGSNLNVISDRDLKLHYINVCRSFPLWKSFLDIYGFPDYESFTCSWTFWKRTSAATWTWRRTWRRTWWRRRRRRTRR